MGYNKDQLAALQNPMDVDLLISAGAGSGKTKTLSMKVKYLIDPMSAFKDGIIASEAIAKSLPVLKPSRLLVLTFTNNSAFDMKNKIIEKFADNKDIALQLASAHIQTFDSFNMYLVSQYSGKLQIPERFTLANEDVLNAKKNEFVDQVFDEYYADNAKKTRLLASLIKFNMRDDALTKRLILDLVNRLSEMSKIERDDYLNNYNNKFLSKTFFDDLIHELAETARRGVEDYFFYASFIEIHKDVIKGKDFNRIRNLFKERVNFTGGIGGLIFDDTNIIQPLYDELFKVLLLPDVDFIEKVKSFKDDNEQLMSDFNEAYKKPSNNAAYYFKQIFNEKDGPLASILKLGDLDDEYKKLLYFKDDIALFLEMAGSAILKLDNYKKITNSYTFKDISNLALSLLTDPSFEAEAEEIRNRFDYIMVDEYQDTSDTQELLLNSLLKIKKDGSRSHLFCVGDVKQCIYAFRDSNVQLFRNRQNKYSDPNDPTSKAIDMNINYRSGERLLKDINYIFNYYMTLNHGAIDYQKDKETLKYDTVQNLYNHPYNYFGIYRITSTSGVNNDNAPFDAKLWEARAIAMDIKNKIDNHFQVSDFLTDSKTGKTYNGLRDCSFKDFCILVRKRANIKMLQEVFQEVGIPLNCEFKNSLGEVSAVIVIQSLMGLLEYRFNKTPLDVIAAHYYASIARSYLFEVSDQKIFDDLYIPEGQPRDYSKLETSDIITRLDKIVSNDENASLSKIYLDLIEEFGVITNLYKIGNVDDVISKIESLYQMAISQEKNGGGVSEFVSMMNSISKYDLDLKSSTLYQVDDAVDLMTIHGSKGLQRKIVYMPCDTNSIGRGGGDARVKPDYTFSKKYGLILPYYKYSFVPNTFDHLDDKSYVTTILDLIEKVTNEVAIEEENEHVRLFYVALTRAENSLYIVGDLERLDPDKIQSEMSKNSLYGMLCYAPHYHKIKEDYLLDKVNSGIITQGQLDEYHQCIDNMKQVKREISPDVLNPIEYNRYAELWKKYYLDEAYKKLESAISGIEKSIYKDFYFQIKAAPDLDKVAKLFTQYFFSDDTIAGKADLLVKYTFDPIRDKEKELPFEISDENVDELLMKFYNAIVNADPDGMTFLGLAAGKGGLGKKSGIADGLKDDLLPIYITILDNIKDYETISFETNDYPDHVVEFDYHSYTANTSSASKTTLSEELPLSNVNIQFDVRIKSRASMHSEDAELPDQAVLDEGVRLHRLLELVDLKTKDTSFIKNENDKKLIDNILAKFFLFGDLLKAEIYSEYGYYDVDLDTTGFIDLLIIKDGHYYIVDYKTNYIYKEDYEHQLHVYQRNIQRIFNITDTSKIHLYLLSIKKGDVKKVDPQ